MIPEMEKKGYPREYGGGNGQRVGAGDFDPAQP
jgi:hypothetical protein